MIMISEVGFYSLRPFVHMLLSGVFERFPRMKFVMTEASAAVFPPLLKQLDQTIANVRKGEIGELKYTSENAIQRSASEYFMQNVWIGASFPGPADWAARSALSAGPLHVGQRLPARRGLGAVHEGVACARCSTTCPSPSCATCSRATRRSSTASTSTRSHRSPRQYGPTVEELATPLTELPDKPNAALLRAAAKAGALTPQLPRSIDAGTDQDWLARGLPRRAGWRLRQDPPAGVRPGGRVGCARPAVRVRVAR